MLGQQLGEEVGRITGMRVLPSEGHGPKVEASFQASGTLLGMNMIDMGTYYSIIGAGGVLHGDGQGVLMTEDGDMATWTGQGVGTLTGHGTAVNWRGAIYFQTASERLARLNSVVVVFEYDVDESGNTHARTWEWK